MEERPAEERLLLERDEPTLPRLRLLLVELRLRLLLRLRLELLDRRDPPDWAELRLPELRLRL